MVVEARQQAPTAASWVTCSPPVETRPTSPHQQHWTLSRDSGQRCKHRERFPLRLTPYTLDRPHAPSTPSPALLFKAKRSSASGNVLFRRILLALSFLSPSSVCCDLFILCYLVPPCFSACVLSPVPAELARLCAYAHCHLLPSISESVGTDRLEICLGA